jgi:adenosylmethionine-8-amino-7-oxononanoate aminotransferase
MADRKPNAKPISDAAAYGAASNDVPDAASPKAASSTGFGEAEVDSQGTASEAAASDSASRIPDAQRLDSQTPESIGLQPKAAEADSPASRVLKPDVPELSMRELDRRHVWHPFTQAALTEAPIPIVEARGTRLVAEDGTSYIDAIGSWWVNVHGHSHPKIAEAIAEQAHTLEHVIFAGFTHKPATRLAARLANLLPDPLTRIFYSDNGSTAVEVALKMAMQLGQRAAQPKTRILALEGGYHGDTFGAMAVSARDAFTAPFFPYLFPVDYIPAPLPGEEARSLQALDEALAAGDVAVLVYEPLVQGASGMRMMSSKALETLLLKARQAGAMLLADEVMTGFGRTGTLFASEQMAPVPDFVALSKGLTGGAMAMGATACSEKVYRAFWSTDMRDTMFHGHSFTANPMACAAALASLDLTETADCRQKRDALESAHLRFIESVLKPHPMAQDPRCCGVILAFELAPTKPKPEAAETQFPKGGEQRIEQDADPAYFHGWRNRIYRFFLDRGILMRPLGNTVYMLPPYSIDKEELQACYHAMEALLKASMAWARE